MASVGGIDDLEDVKKKMFARIPLGSLESFKAIVLNPSLDDEQRKTLLNSLDIDGWTVMHLATFHSRTEIIAWLLSDEGRAAGFDNVLTKGEDGRTALHAAAQLGRLECCQAILNGCREDERHEMINAVDKDGWTVLHHAVNSGKLDIISWILTEGVAAGFDRKNITALTKRESFSALHFAMQADIEIMQILLSHCNDQERMNLFLCVDKRGWTALHHAARAQAETMVIELLQYPECSLIANRKDNSGMTVLHQAIIGCLDGKSRNGWRYYFEPIPQVISALLGSPSIDPNIGLGLE